MIFLSEDLGRVEVRLFLDEAARSGKLVRTADGGLEVAPVPIRASIEPVEAWLRDAGLEVFERRRRGRRWILRARLAANGLDM